MFPMIDCLVKFLEKCIIGIPFENLESLSENLLMWKEFVLSQGLEPHPDWDRVEITRENFLACVSQSRYEFTIARIKEK